MDKHAQLFLEDALCDLEEKVRAHGITTMERDPKLLLQSAECTLWRQRTLVFLKCTFEEI